jgi:alpha-L-rhamnosidase
MDKEKKMTESSLLLRNLRSEYKVNPIGIDVQQPRLSWQLVSSRRGTMQAAYQIQVAERLERLQAGDRLLWDSGKVDSDASIHRAYEGPALRSGQRCYWRVRAWDNDDQPTVWSEPAFWEMGLLSPADWEAEWIEPDWEKDPEVMHPCPYLRRTFDVQGEVRSARVYVTSHGLYELALNGTTVGDRVFTPGCTSYQVRLQYQTYDVGDLLAPGENAVGVILGDGWYRGKVATYSMRNVYGNKLALLMQLHIVYADGDEQYVISDGDWKATTGPILKSDLKDGETYDARLEMPGWDAPDFEDSAWKGVQVVDHAKDNLVAPIGPPVRRQEEFTPVEIIHTPNEETVVDLGQNIAGRVRLRVQGPAGTRITMQHGEALDKDGNFTMDNLKMPMGKFDELLQEVQYTLKGDGEEVYEPHFTFQGFRYARVEGFPGEPSADNFTGIAIYSDMAQTGTFECSNPMINQLQHNVEWSQKGNFLDIPTDCPQRERAGWTGDAQVFVRTGSFIMDTAAFFHKWLKDLAADQQPDGLVPNLVPNPVRFRSTRIVAALEGSAGWGDAAVIVPWTIYLCYGDVRLLEEQYESMKAWVDYMDAHAQKRHWTKKISPAYWFGKKNKRQRYIWDTKYHWGEWLEPGAWKRSLWTLLGNLAFSQPLVATSYYAYSSGLLAQVARVLNKEDDANKYGALHEQIKSAYVAQFFGHYGRIVPDKQASYARALALDLVPKTLHLTVIRHLVELIRKNGDHLGTGFLSTPFLCHVLGQTGHLDLAYRLLNQDTYPSWLYPVTKGATTIWENWDAIDKKGKVRGSLNHYSYGAIGSWLYQVVAGIELDPKAPGYKHFFIQPQPGGGLTYACATYQSMYGEIASAWELAGADDFTLRVTVPANTSATVRLPGATLKEVTESGRVLSEVESIIGVRQDDGSTIVQVGSGHYEFTYRMH